MVFGTGKGYIKKSSFFFDINIISQQRSNPFFGSCNEYNRILEPFGSVESQQRYRIGFQACHIGIGIQQNLM